MKNKILSLLMVVGLLCGLSLTSCKENESGVANAVIASTHSIIFPAQGTFPVSVDVTADGEWHVDTPDWITVTPSTGGAGRTEVLVQVSENILGDAPDRPRKFTLKFMGEKSLSAYDVLVSQEGDKYRNLSPIAIADLASLEDDDAAMLGGVTVVSATENGYVVSDGSDFVYVADPKTKASADDKIAKGSKVDILGSKFEADGFPYLTRENITVTGQGTMPTATAQDITGSLDKFKSDKQIMVKATGAFDGTILNVAEQTNNVQITDADIEAKLADLKGHQLEVTGIYGGTAAPVVKIIATEIKDLGLNEIIYFQDDFEWMLETNILTYQSSGKNVSDNVGKGMLSGAYNPQSTTLKTPDGETVWDLLTKRGYGMYSTSTAQAKKSIGCAVCYIKMAVTTYTAKLELPKMPEAGDGVENVKLKFDWTPMTDGGKAVWDQVEICVEVTTDGTTKVFPVDPVAKEDGFLEDGKTPKTPYEWVTVDMVLDGVKINKDTRISLRNADPNYPQTQVEGAKMRWFVDNIKVYKPKD